MRIVVAVVAVVLALGAPAAAQRKQPDAIKVQSLSELLRLSVEKDDLVLRTNVPPNNMAMTPVTVADFPGQVQVRTMGPPNEKREWVVPQNFWMSANQQKDGGNRSLNVNVSTGMINIQSSGSSDATNRTVALTCATNPQMMGRQDAVTLSVSSNRAGQPGTNTNYGAASFEALRRRFPREVDEHLRPLLADLGQDHLFAADPFVAWQVFASDFVPDPAVHRAVLGLVADLGAADYRARDAAAARLADLGPAGALVVMRLDRDALKLDLEQRARLDAALAPYQTLTRAEADRRRGDVVFLLDCLGCPDAKIRAIGLGRLRQVTGEPIAFDAAGDAAADAKARAEAVARLRARLTPKPED